MDVDGHQAVWNRRRGDRRSGVSDRGKQGGQTPIVDVDGIKVSRGGKSGSRMGTGKDRRREKVDWDTFFAVFPRQTPRVDVDEIKLCGQGSWRTGNEGRRNWGGRGRA